MCVGGLDPGVSVREMPAECSVFPDKSSLVSWTKQLHLSQLARGMDTALWSDPPDPSHLSGLLLKLQSTMIPTAMGFWMQLKWGMRCRNGPSAQESLSGDNGNIPVS